MFGALVAAAKVNSSYLSEANTVAGLIQTNFWRTCSGSSGYNASAGNCGDRYTDDNAWVALALLELYEITNNSTYLIRARSTITFCMAFENGTGDIPDGGIRWHETSACGANVCSTGPTCLANLIIYQKTGIASYLTDGMRLYNWLITSGVQDSVTGLYWQSINCSGGIDYGFLGYETALPLQAALRLYQITGTAEYLTEAQRLAAKMEAEFVNASTHAFKQQGCWGGHDMTNALVDLYAIDKNPHWMDVVSAYLVYVHDNCKFSGRYPDVWNNTSGTTSPGLLANASVARAYWKLASAAYITPYLSVNGGGLQQTANANLQVGNSITLSPQSTTGGTWNWSGPNGFSAGSREITINTIRLNQAGTYTATFTTSYGVVNSQEYSVTATYWTSILNHGFEAGGTLSVNGWTASSGATWLINTTGEGNPANYAWGGGSSTTKANLVSGSISKNTGYVIGGYEMFNLTFDVRRMVSLVFNGSILASLYYMDGANKVILGTAEVAEDQLADTLWHAGAGNLYAAATDASIGKNLYVSFEGGPSSWNGSSAQRLGIDNVFIQKATLCEMADISYDAQINVEDILIFCQLWLNTSPDTVADIWPDNTVDMKDFLVISKCWNESL
jgi:hypothetical protein